jgi:hypothetical protein
MFKYFTFFTWRVGNYFNTGQNLFFLLLESFVFGRHFGWSDSAVRQNNFFRWRLAVNLFELGCTSAK